MDPQLAAMIRSAMGPLAQRLQALEAEVSRRQAHLTWKDALDAGKGRRVFFNLVGTQDFTASDDGKRTAAISFLISQDGPFVMTHYPVAMWRSKAPSNATDFGRWRPVSSWPLADQVLDTNIVDLSYEMNDSGSQRNFQNAASPPLLSRPDDLKELPVHTLFKENSTIQFTPTYENILFNDSTATTDGTLVVCIPGYRIITGASGNY